MRRVLVTGASGFIGTHLIRSLASEDFQVRALTRRPLAASPGVELIVTNESLPEVEWASVLEGVDVVIHLAAAAHLPDASDDDFDRVNHHATARFAEQAAAARVERFVFISSIGAQVGSAVAHVLTEDVPPRPVTPYGRSKLAAERAVRAVGVPFTVLRPCLVYGPGVGGNMRTLINVARTPWPLPFGAFTNRRSLLAVDSLISAIKFVVTSPGTLNETFLVADPEALTLAQIIAAVRAGAQQPTRLFAVPPDVIRLFLAAMGRGELWNRLGGNLVVNPGKLLAAGWRPAADARTALTALVPADEVCANCW